jgi:ferric enterobactin receptor
MLEAQPDITKGVGRISGRVIDSVTKEPVEYATISLIAEDNDKVVDGAVTDSKGFFKMGEIKEGAYKMLVYFIGYKTAVYPSIIVNKEKSELVLGDLLLASQQLVLKEVIVSTEKSLIENKIDKLVFNAENDVTSQGGVATDVLKKVPMVSVNADGSVELLGNSNIRFLINGKPSSVFGNNIVDVLQTIPASQIQSIEVITSPGAKYDAEGTGGIINIILKKNVAQGINGTLSLTGGTRLENGSFNLSMRKGKLGVNTFVSGNAQLSSTTINNLNRLSTEPSTGNNTSLLQNGTSDFIRTGYQSGMSFDWDVSEKNNINGGFTYNNFGTQNNGSTNREQLLKNTSGDVLSDINNLVLANNKFNTEVFDWNVNYKKKFRKEGQEFDLLYSSSISSNYSYYQQTQKIVSLDSLFSGAYGKNPGTDMQTNISANYTHPITEKLFFETGIKTVLYQINAKSDVFTLNPSSGNFDFNATQSNTVNYGRNIYSAFLSATVKLKYVDVKAGVRNEYTDTKATFSNVGNIGISPYNTIVPSGTISHSFKNNHMLKISYSYRIQRPDYRDLNPFVNATDPKNVSTGNPNLKPETTHNIELGYSKFFEKGLNINVNVFYRGNRADIQSFTSYYSAYQIGDSVYSNVAVSIRENIGREDNFGVNLSASLTMKKKFNVRTNAAIFQRYIYNSIVPGANIKGFNYRVSLNLSYQVSSTFVIEAFGYFNSPRVYVQGTMPAFNTYNFALRKQFFDKKMSIAFTTTNPFNKYVDQKTQTKGVNFTSTGLSQLPYRSFGVNFTWKFGKLEFKRQREGEELNAPPIQGN